MLTKLKPNCNTTIISEAAKSQLNDMIQSLINISANFDRQNLVARVAHAANRRFGNMAGRRIYPHLLVR